MVTRTQPDDHQDRLARIMEEWTRSNWEQVRATRELQQTIRELGEGLQPLVKKLQNMGGLAALAGLLRGK